MCGLIGNGPTLRVLGATLSAVSGICLSVLPPSEPFFSPC